MFPVVILAGGLATRMRPITENIPKSMVPVAGIPFIHYQMCFLKEQGADKVVLCVGHLGEQIEKYIGDGSLYGLDIVYSYDGPKLLGTGGAIMKALPLLGDAFFVMYGDSYLTCNLAKVEHSFLKRNSKAMLTVYQNNNQLDQSNIELISTIGCWVLRYDKEKPTGRMKYIDYGLGAMRSWVFEEYCYELNSLSEIYKRLSRCNLLMGYEVRNRFYEIGSKKGLADFEVYIRGKI